MESLLVQDIGESGLLQKIHSFCAAKTVGDDGAVLPTKATHQLVVTTDVLVDQVHFSDRTTTAFDVGWRSVAANLSDLAAMGAFPIGITVGLSLPGTTPVAWIEELYQGFTSCLQQFDTPIVGGDVTRSQVITIAITALGEVLPQQVITRFAAQPGDAIVVTGYHGLSRAGLELLLNPQIGETLTSQEKAILIKAHQRPQPRLDAIAKLRQIAPDALVTGMDSSDGLGDAISQICRCSQVGAVISSQSLPQCSILEKLSPSNSVEQWIFNGGEDFELILCMSPQLAQEFLPSLGNCAAIIGQIIAEPQIIFEGFSHKIKHDLASLNGGFQHFKVSHNIQ